MGSDSPRSSRSIRHLGQESFGSCELGSTLELGAVRGWLQRQFEPAEPGIEPAGQGSERRLDQPLDLASGGLAVLLGIVEVAAGLGVGVGAAADDRQRDRAGQLPLDFVAGIAGPFGTDLVELAAQGCAMAGVAEEHGPDLAGRIGRSQHGQAMVDRPVGIDAEIDPAAVLQDPSVGREIRLTLAPRQARRRAGRQGSKSRLSRSRRSARGCSVRSGPSGRPGCGAPKMKSSPLLKAGPQCV